MTTQLHDIGEEFEQNVLSGNIALPTSVTIILYHDGEVSGDTTAGDDLTSTSDIGAITTQPDGTSYAGQTVSLDGSTSWTLSTDANTDYQIEVSATLTYDLSDSANPTTIDAYGVVVNWDDGAGAADHLWWTDTLDQAFDVSSVDTLNVDDAGIAKTGSGTV